jgi:hypothetical protein
MNILETMGDPLLFGPWFQGTSWDAWRCVLKATAALPMTEAEVATFRSLADRDPLAERVREAWIIAGRRCGKDSIASLIAAHAAAFFDPADRLRPGERAVVLCLAVDRDQAKIVHRYIRAYFRDIGFLKRMVTRETRDGFELENGVDVVIGTNDFRVTRGRPVLCAILDECAFWKDEHSYAPDTETYAAILPGTLTLPGSLIIGISTPYRRGGLLHQKWKDSYGQAGDVLVIRAPSTKLNPTLDQAAINRELARDPASGKAEWLAEWRDDIAAYLDRALIENAVDRGVTARAPVPGVSYRAFADPSGGVSDSYALAIAHQADGMIVLDALIEQKAPFNPAEVTGRMAAVLRTYGLKECFGDRYAGSWVPEAFRAHGIAYRHSELDRSKIYLDMLPLLTSGRARLLDNDRLAAQFAALERSTSAHGDRIDHPQALGHHDDLSNAAAGALTVAASSRYDVPRIQLGNWGNPPLPSEASEAALWGKANVAAGSSPTTLRPEDFGDPVRQVEAIDRAVRWMEAMEAAKQPPQGFIPRWSLDWRPAQGRPLSDTFPRRPPGVR